MHGTANGGVPELQLEFENEWRTARRLELDGKLDEARSIYSALIEEDPERLYVRLRLSAIEEAYGHYRVARSHAVRAAEAVRNERWKDMAVVTRRLLTFDEPKLVHELIMGADWSHSEIIKNSHLLSQHLWLTGYEETALELIAVAEAHSRPSYALAYSKANALRYLGKLDEATRAYERCLDLEPAYPYAHWSLAYHQRSTLPSARVPRIQSAKSQFDASSSEQVFLDFALFKEHHDGGNFEQAWQSLKRGAALKRASLAYDSELEEEGFRSLRSTAAPGSAELHETSSGPTPIFIVGMPRSGTTLLERILGNSVEVASAGELNDFRTALCLSADQFLSPQITAEYANALAKIDPEQVGRTYTERTAHKAEGRRFVVDKNPANFIHAGYIAKSLPQAKILCLRRAPMDACFSNLKELFPSDAYGYSYDLEELADHYVRFRSLCDFWSTSMPNHFHVVDFEELVAEPKKVAKEVLDFCGIQFDPRMLDITNNKTPVSTASSSQVREPINSKGIGAWRQYSRELLPLQARLEKALGPVS